MENTTNIRVCHYCQVNPARPDSNWCSEICFEIWYSLEQAQMLNEALNKILSKGIKVVEDANTRPS